MSLLKKLRSGGSNKVLAAERVVAASSSSSTSAGNNTATTSPALEELLEEDFEAGMGNVSAMVSTMTTPDLSVVRVLLVPVFCVHETINLDVCRIGVQLI